MFQYGNILRYFLICTVTDLPYPMTKKIMPRKYKFHDNVIFSVVYSLWLIDMTMVLVM